MRKALIAFLLSTTILNGTVALAQNTSYRPEGWETKEGDYLVIDLNSNTGYLINEKKDKTQAFKVITGQKQFVRHIGLRYFGATPPREWEVKEKITQPDRITYGKDGSFLRLYYKDKSTHYGIHSHRYAKSMFDKENRYQSMGCIIVTDEWLEILEKIFELNGNKLKVTTTQATDEFAFLQE